MVDVSSWAQHSAYSDPGPFAPLFLAVPSDLETVCAASLNLAVNFRGAYPDLPQIHWPEVDSRWVQSILRLDQSRHPGMGLDEPRALKERVAGCCRDHSLLTVAILREHGIPARSRVGFANYLTPNWHYDHVIVELWDGDRWVLTDPEMADRDATAAGDAEPFDPRDMISGIGAPYETAAQVWTGYRAGTIDPSRYGVYLGSNSTGADFVQMYVIFEVAHRFRDELLLWDGWGATMHAPPELTDELAALLLRADAGDQEAENALAEWYRTDDRLHPGSEITQHSPFGLPPKTVSLV